MGGEDQKPSFAPGMVQLAQVVKRVGLFSLKVLVHDAAHPEEKLGRVELPSPCRCTSAGAERPPRGRPTLPEHIILSPRGAAFKTGYIAPPPGILGPAGNIWPRMDPFKMAVLEKRRRSFVKIVRWKTCPGDLLLSLWAVNFRRFPESSDLLVYPRLVGTPGNNLSDFSTKYGDRHDGANPHFPPPQRRHKRPMWFSQPLCQFSQKRRPSLASGCSLWRSATLSHPDDPVASAQPS